MIAYFDIFSGISGDMTLGALVDLGVPVDYLQKKLSPVLKGFELKSRQVFKSHLAATDIDVVITEEQGTSRNYSDIKTMIEKAPLPETVRQNSLTAFEKIARAEAGIHGKDINSVHFHEIGGVDSIVDIIGSFLAIDYLEITKVYASAVPLGSGFVKCSHGNIPVPVPATIAILKGVPVISSDAKTEIVTPTGAAIITTLTDQFATMPRLTVKQTGYGSGKRDTGSSLPNLLRVVLGEELMQETVGTQIFKESIQVLKTNIDDMSPEGLGFLMDRLLEANALDVTHLPVQMKKNRPGVQVEVLCRPEDLDQLVEIILTHTSSIGVRHHSCERSFLKRELVEVNTRFGSLQMKQVIRPDGETELIPEYEVVAKTALEKGLTFKAVYNQVLADANFLDRD